MEIPLLQSLRVIERLPGHIPTRGKSAGEELNWAYRLEDTTTNQTFIGMFCKPNHITFIDESIWTKLQTEEYRHLTWYYAPIGYISRTVKENDMCEITYLHQFILDHYGKGRGGNSIDHINQNKIDNRTENLRITTQSTQNTNRGKVSRHKNARDLPAEIQDPLPKYCVYYKEALNKEKTRWREFFTIEGHPAQCGKRVATTKSNKVSIMDKLHEANLILKSLDT